MVQTVCLSVLATSAAFKHLNAYSSNGVLALSLLAQYYEVSVAINCLFDTSSRVRPESQRPYSQTVHGVSFSLIKKPSGAYQIYQPHFKRQKLPAFVGLFRFMWLKMCPRAISFLSKRRPFSPLNYTHIRLIVCHVNPTSDCMSSKNK